MLADGSLVSLRVWPSESPPRANDARAQGPADQKAPRRPWPFLGRPAAIHPAGDLDSAADADAVDPSPPASRDQAAQCDRIGRLLACGWSRVVGGDAPPRTGSGGATGAPLVLDVRELTWRDADAGADVDGAVVVDEPAAVPLEAVFVVHALDLASLGALPPPERSIAVAFSSVLGGARYLRPATLFESLFCTSPPHLNPVASRLSLSGRQGLRGDIWAWWMLEIVGRSPRGEIRGFLCSAARPSLRFGASVLPLRVVAARA